MPNEDKTRPRPVLPLRPKYGWLAWESTVGYIALQHAPDALLQIEIYPLKEVISWSASLTWGQNQEAVAERVSFGAVLSDLWREIETNHPLLLQTPEARARRPVQYDEDSWLDDATFAVFSRLVGVTETAFRGDWRIIIMYQPVENPNARVQARLLANQGEVQIGGRGPSLREACRMVFRNAAVSYKAYASRETE